MSVVVKLAVEGSDNPPKTISESTNSLKNGSQTKRRKTHHSHMLTGNSSPTDSHHHSHMLTDNSTSTDAQPLIELSGVWFKVLQ